MLAKRIIPCLDVKDGRTVKGVNFLNLKDAGDPVELGKRYSDEGADELVFLDITASHERRKTLADMVRRVARNISIPFTVGGGIGSIEDVENLLNAGADKISINSSALYHPQLIEDIAKRFGSQVCVVAIDARNEGGTWQCYVKGGRERFDKQLMPWAHEVQERGAGEILFTSMDHDGETRIRLRSTGRTGRTVVHSDYRLRRLRNNAAFCRRVHHRESRCSACRQRIPLQRNKH